MTVKRMHRVLSQQPSVVTRVSLGQDAVISLKPLLPKGQYPIFRVSRLVIAATCNANMTQFVLECARFR